MPMHFENAIFHITDEGKAREVYLRKAITATLILHFKRCLPQSGNMEKWMNGRTTALSYLKKAGSKTRDSDGDIAHR